MSKTVRGTTSALILSCLLISHAAGAQPGLSRLELWGGLTLVAPNVEATVATSYTPLIDRYSAPLAGTTAGQAIQLVGGNAIGIGGGLNLFFSNHVGFQFLFDSDRADLTGANGDYHVLLNYTAMQPPDFVSKPYSYSRVFTACEAGLASGCVDPTAGSLRQTSLGFNLVGRWPVGKRVDVELSGGLSYFDLRGDARSLRYTLFEMGGHSTLFSEEYRLAYSVGPAHGWGIDVGGSLDVNLGKHVALVADARYFTGGEIAAPLGVTDVLNKDELAFLQEPDVIQQNLHPPAAGISPTRARILVGVKVR
jgi:hypothetical protein